MAAAMSLLSSEVFARNPSISQVSAKGLPEVKAMKIECRVTGLEHPNANLMTFFKKVLEHAARELALDKSMIGRVIIASHDRFGSAVSSIKPGETFTDNETAVAAGKTIPRLNAGKVVSDIILQSSLFEVLVDVLSDSPVSGDWRVDQQQALYVICHEFGHAQDHTLRADAFEVSDPRSAAFKIESTADYYGSMVLTEYAACRNAAAAMTAPLFGHEMQDAVGRIVHEKKEVNHYLDNPNLLTRRALAHTVCQGVWLIMVELTKLYGHAGGESGRVEKVNVLEHSLLRATRLADVLTRYGDAYPNWDTQSQIEELIDLWQEFSGIFRVRFIACDGLQDDFEQVV